MKLLNYKIFFYFIILAAFLLGEVATAQTRKQSVIDSLKDIIACAGEDTNKVVLLNALSYAYGNFNPDSGMAYGKQSLTLASRLQWKKGIAASYSNMGVNSLSRSDYPKALDYDFKALGINEALGDKQGVAACNGNIGLIYENRGDYTRALEYHAKALRINDSLGYKKGVAINAENIGNIYELQDDYAKAIQYLLMALKINREAGSKSNIANNLGNLGTVYASQKEYSKALASDFEALRNESELGNKTAIATNLGNIGEIYYFIAAYTKGAIKTDSLVPGSKQANIQKSVNYLAKGVDACKEIGFRKGVIKFTKSLSAAYVLEGDYKKALQYHKEYCDYKDSVFSLDNNRRLKLIENQQDEKIRDKNIQIARLGIQRNRLEIEKKRNERVFYIVGISALLGLIFFIAWERKKSEKLLLNILPEKIAERLKRKEHPIADHFPDAAIIFIDMAGFTMFTENRDPKDTVSTLNDVFTHFDSLAEKHGLEKIKTIGDCYMAVAGLPEPREDHAWAAAAMALDVRDTMKGYKAKDGTEIHFRIGLDSGSVVAGVIGKKKFIYDLWGDAVNTASRMESTGIPGEIHCTDNFKQEVETGEKGRKITFTSRGKIEIKSKGLMQTWLIS